MQLAESLLSLLQATAAFKVEWLGHYRNRQGSEFRRQRSHDRRAARASSATQTRGHEHHVGSFEHLDNLVRVFQRCLSSHFRIGSRAQTLRQTAAKLNLHRRPRTRQRLQVCICDHEFDSLDARVNHAIHGVPAAAADTDHFYAGPGNGRFIIYENINAFAGFAYFRCHSPILSSELGKLPLPLSLILGRLGHWRLYLADNILCQRVASIQYLVKKYYW